MQDHSQIEIQRVREESRHYQHKLRLETIAYRNASAALLLIFAHNVLNLFISSPPGKAILTVVFLVALFASGVISYRAGKRAKKEYGK